MILRSAAATVSNPELLTENQYFRVRSAMAEKSTQIELEMMMPIVYSDQIPKLLPMLRRHLPQIHLHECQNYANVPFIEEARRTEIGHLFEHILLEYLSQLSGKLPSEERYFVAQTSWDWLKEREGIFHLDINIGEHDQSLFTMALAKTIVLFEKLLKTTVIDAEALN